MESILNCWGQWVFHNRIKVILAWLILFCALAAGVAKIGTNFNSDLKISGLAATDVQKVLKKDFKQDPNKASMRVVISGKAGILNNAHVQQAIINKVNSVAKNEKHIKNISNPYQMQAISKDFSTAYIDIAFDQSSNLVSTHNLQKIQNEFAELSSKQNLKINFAGSIASGSSQSNPYAETLGIIIAFILLMVLFRSFITAGMPIISAALGLISGLLLVMIGTNFFTIANVAQTLASMLGLAVGIDYGLFIINRYRLAISKKTPHQVALGATLASAGSSVFFAGITVIIAVLGLSLIKIDFLTQMGFAAAISVTFAVLSSLTLLPALIALLQKFVRPTKKQITQVTKSKSSLQEVVFKKPWLVGLVSALILIGIAIPATHMRLGMPYDGALPNHRTEKKAYDTLSKKFGKGFNAHLVAIVKLKDSKTTAQKVTTLGNIQKDISKFNNVALVSPGQLSANKHYGLMVIVPKTGPENAKTEKLVRQIAHYNTTHKNKLQGNVILTGTNAVNIEISKKLNQAIPLFAGLVMFLALILLTFVFRSFVIPLFAMIGFGLSLFASFGLVTLVMQDGWLKNLFGISTGAPILAFLPVIVIGVLFGLAMDYQVFLVSRIREAYLLTKDTQEAVKIGLHENGPVITTAALIMIAVFGSFAMTEEPTVKAMGISLAFGVFFDAFLVRLLFIPAMIKVFGKINWYFPKMHKRL